jgi:hypothetical protein
VVAVQPKGGHVVVATGITPVDRYCRTKAPSISWGPEGRASEPIRIGRPATVTLSLNADGTPAKGADVPAGRWLARLRARSWSSTVVAPSTGLTAAMRAMAASTASVALMLPARIAAATPVASRVPSASSAKADTRRLSCSSRSSA